ncbi:bifunctional diaminohydroxyphosphoribosylaminopyrimidine deaminase/5-amino-6-(5-phosphoribosylamino)uracil reductase RibD [Acidobacteria bacterium AH-259-D05]|nr:bifunctional diaminohydroxyphosphoribosylaminopyrimidine deaminase/5-amino-6-(5-phosphoribosylamino)uracil reductase RibD [Acidobacteria bacterium AH-259-D05]
MEREPRNQVEQIKDSEYIHRRFMKQAVALARRGVGRVSPNPLVGAVVVQKGQVVGGGYHLYDAKEHAEVIALQRAGGKAFGASLYVNLEPCAHYGRTPPCVDQIIGAGISKVFVAVRDPNLHAGRRGVQVLRRRRVAVHLGICREEATQQNEKFLHFVQTNRPFVLLKLALTLDGRIATCSGDSQWITQTRARKQAHRLRYEYDAILVGVETVLQDDPSLDVRWTRRNQITKVILDSKLRTPPKAKLFKSSDRVIFFHSRRASEKRIDQLAKKAELIEVTEQNGLLNWNEILGELARLMVTSLIIEGGAGVAASALKAGIIQKINFFYGPKIIGGSGRSGIDDLGIDRLKKAVNLEAFRVKRLPPDFMVEGYLG